MDNKTTVAIEIASSKIKGAVGTVGSDGRITVQAVVEMPSEGNVRYGRVQNIREVSAAVSAMLRRLEEANVVAPRRIRALALSLGGRSLSSAPAKASLNFNKECEITANHVERLAISATNDIVGDRSIQATLPRTYYVNNSSVPRPSGTYGVSLRGDFTVVSCAKETRQNLDRLRFDGIEPENTAIVVLPLAVADLVLTQEEKSVGTVFADFGAETSTVAVYKDGSLAFLTTIPMGSRLIVRDIMTAFSTTEENAEDIIRRYSDDDKEIKETDAGKYIRARAGEIMANVQHQLELAGFGKDVIGKAVITGGATHIPDIREQFEFQTKLKSRLAQLPANVTFCVPNRNNADNIDIVALLAAAAPLFRTSCLTNIEIPNEETAPEELEEEQDTVVVMEDIHKKIKSVSEHHILDDDDSELLKDDPDTEEKKEKNQPKRGIRKLFSFGGKKNNVDIDEIEEKSSYEEEEEPEYKEEETESHDVKATKEKDYMSGFGKRMARIFTQPENLYKDDYDEDNQ